MIRSERLLAVCLFALSAAFVAATSASIVHADDLTLCRVTVIQSDERAAVVVAETNIDGAPFVIGTPPTLDIERTVADLQWRCHLARIDLSRSKP